MNRILFLLLFIFPSTINLISQTYVHIVTDRDNIHKLARIYGVTAKQIAKINKLDSTNIQLMEHSILIIPDKNYQEEQPSGRMIKNIIHRVEKNESLYTISRKYGVTVYDLLLLNPHLDRGLPLQEGEELNVQVTMNAESQYSRQIIYLNGDLYKFNLIEVKDSFEFELVKKFNATLDDRIAEAFEAKQTSLAIDSFPYPENDQDMMTRLIYYLVSTATDSFVDKTLWLDSMYEEVFYVGSELNEKKINADPEFISKALTTIYKLNIAKPSNDFLFGLRAVIYYWLGSHRKSLIFTDETLAIQPNNESALMVRAAIGQLDGHIPYAKSITQKLYESKPRNFLLYNLGTLHYTNQEFSKAIELYSQLLKKEHFLAPEINYRIGHSYILQGDVDNGCEYIKEAEKARYHRAISMRHRSCKK